jgi:two-component system cell cycle sensor histidine kinase/response regulator CckA
VLEAVDGQHALRLARDNRVHLLFTDVVMPDMTGWELASRLRSVLPDIRVLYTSGYSEDTIGAASDTDMETDFIEKPFSPGELALRIRAVLEA